MWQCSRRRNCRFSMSSFWISSIQTSSTGLWMRIGYPFYQVIRSKSGCCDGWEWFVFWAKVWRLDWGSCWGSVGSWPLTHSYSAPLVHNDDSLMERPPFQRLRLLSAIVADAYSLEYRHWRHFMRLCYSGWPSEAFDQGPADFFATLMTHLMRQWSAYV